MYIDICKGYCGLSPVKATGDMTQPVGQRDGQLFTYGDTRKNFTEHIGMSVESESIKEIYFVFATARSEPVDITIGGDDWETAARVSANGGYHHIFTDGGFIFFPGEYPFPMQNITRAEIDGADISNVHIYYR